MADVPNWLIWLAAGPLALLGALIGFVAMEAARFALMTPINALCDWIDRLPIDSAPNGKRASRQSTHPDSSR